MGNAISSAYAAVVVVMAVLSVKAHQKPPGRTLVSKMQINTHARAHTHIHTYSVNELS